MASSELKDAKDAYEAVKERLTNEHLASAGVREVLAPLEQKITELEGKSKK